MTFHPYFLSLYLFTNTCLLIQNYLLGFCFGELLYFIYCEKHIVLYSSPSENRLFKKIIIPLSYHCSKFPHCLAHCSQFQSSFPVLSPHPSLHLAWSSLWSMVCNILIHIFFLLVGSIVPHFTISDIIDRGTIIHIDLQFQFMCHSSFNRPDLKIQSLSAKEPWIFLLLWLTETNFPWCISLCSSLQII